MNSTVSATFLTTLINREKSKRIKNNNLPCGTKQRINNTVMKNRWNNQIVQILHENMTACLIALGIISLGCFRQDKYHTSGYKIISSMKNNNFMQECLMNLKKVNL